MYSPALLEHFANSERAGTLEPPAITVGAENPACGDTLRLSLLWRDGRVVDARFQCRGCVAAIGLASACAEWVRGRSTVELATVTPLVLESLVGGLPQTSAHAAILCRDVLRGSAAAAGSAAGENG